MREETSLKGLVLAIRHSGGQPEVVFHYPDQLADKKFLGFGLRDLARFCLNGASWLTNRRFDFEIDAAKHAESGSLCFSDHLRFVSFPCECISFVGQAQAGSQTVASMNIVFILDSLTTNESSAELYWQALSSLTRAFLAEEKRCGYLTKEVSKLQQGFQTDLATCFRLAFNGLKHAGTVSINVNGSLHVNLNINMHTEILDQASIHHSLRTSLKAELQRNLPVDSASIVRRVIDAVEVNKSLREIMLETGLPLSTVQRLFQHLGNWNRAQISYPLTMDTNLLISHVSVKENDDMQKLIADFEQKFGIQFLPTLCRFSGPQTLKQISKNSAISKARVNELVAWLINRDLCSFSVPYFYYSILYLENPRIMIKPMAQISPSLEMRITEQLKSRFNYAEIYTIYSKLGCDFVK